MCRRRRSTLVPCQGLSRDAGPPPNDVPSQVAALLGRSAGGATSRCGRQRRAGGRRDRHFHAGRTPASGTDPDHVAGPGPHWRRRPAVRRQAREHRSAWRQLHAPERGHGPDDWRAHGHGAHRLRARQARPTGHEGHGRRGRCRDREDADADPICRSSRTRRHSCWSSSGNWRGRPCRIGAVWLAQCQSWKRRYPVVQPEYRRSATASQHMCCPKPSRQNSTRSPWLPPGARGAAVELFLLSCSRRSRDSGSCTQEEWVRWVSGSRPALALV